MGSISSAGTWLTKYTQIIRPHWIAPVRSRKCSQSPAAALRIGSSTYAKTGIKMENIPYQLDHTRIYWIGTTAKKAQNSVR